MSLIESLTQVWLLSGNYSPQTSKGCFFVLFLKLTLPLSQKQISIPIYLGFLELLLRNSQVEEILWQHHVSQA